MIDKSVYTLSHIQTLQETYHSDPALIERVLYAFGLLEAITASGMPFCFKGGTSLMLILDQPARLSTDIDILVPPGIDINNCIDKAAVLFPFLGRQEIIRRGKSGIVKRHFKFTYLSPLRHKEFNILLDAVFADKPYAKTTHKEIKTAFLKTTGKNLFVEVPTPECILGDKLTAFAPHTTGVLFGSGKELEIAKQLFDSALLFDHIEDYPLLLNTYDNAVQEESAFRGNQWSKSDVLLDTIQACLTIISKGRINTADYAEYLRGIKSLKNHILLPGHNTDSAVWDACKVMYLASCILSNSSLRRLDPKSYLSERLEGQEYRKLAYVRKQNPDAYAHLVEATRNLKQFS